LGGKCGQGGPHLGSSRTGGAVRQAAGQLPQILGLLSIVRRAVEQRKSIDWPWRAPLRGLRVAAKQWFQLAGQSEQCRGEQAAGGLLVLAERQQVRSALGAERRHGRLLDR